MFFVHAQCTHVKYGCHFPVEIPPFPILPQDFGFHARVRNAPDSLLEIVHMVL